MLSGTVITLAQNQKPAAPSEDSAPTPATHLSVQSLLRLRLPPERDTGKPNLEYASPVTDRRLSALEWLYYRGDAFASRRHRS